MVVRVEVSPELYSWAKDRSGVDPGDLETRFPKLAEWQSGRAVPTVRQLEGFAAATHTPFGFFFLEEPPSEQLPIPDFRTIGDAEVEHPSPDLLDTIYQCQQRQEWYRLYAIENGHDEVRLVGSCSLETEHTDAAGQMREALNFGIDDRGSSWSESLRVLSERAEDVGILVMTSGVVGSNTHRPLNPDEFRGFALIDDYAPTVFTNGADTRAAQVFTLAHELAHVWLGETGVDNPSLARQSVGAVERWCNRVAAEFLVPAQEIRRNFRSDTSLPEELERLALRFKVSTLVVLRRLNEVGHLTWPEFRAAYQAELKRVLEFRRALGAGGGNFYNTQPVRASKTVTRAVVAETLAGRTAYTDAFRMLGLKKVSTLLELGARLGIT